MTPKPFGIAIFKKSDRDIVKSLHHICCDQFLVKTAVNVDQAFAYVPLPNLWGNNWMWDISLYLFH